MPIALGATAPPAAEPDAPRLAATEPVGLRLKTTAVAPAPAHANHLDQGLRMRNSSSPNVPLLFAAAGRMADARLSAAMVNN